MKPNRTALHRAALMLIAGGFLPAGWSLGLESYIGAQPADGALTLVDDSHVAALYVDNADFKGVHRAAGDLKRDIDRVTGESPGLIHESGGLGHHAVIIGTIGKSGLVDRLIESGRIDVSAVRDRWEGYHIETVEAPLPDVERALVIAGSDKRGTIYGVYEISEQIGVSPWYWWADVPVEEKPALYVKPQTRRQDFPTVKYRGIFINHEAPALSGWVNEYFGGYNHRFYEHVFELLLRLKANLLWPAMWNNAFADDDPKNMILADEYGIVMGTSHHEFMMRADKEWNRYGEGPWAYSTNAGNIREFWKEGVKRNKGYESIYTLGMRGQEDTAMSEGRDIELLEQVVHDQREILKNVFDDRDIAEIPQVWCLYKEVQGFYEADMRVPDDVTLLWSDDNWGHIRRLPTPEERERSGGAGVYYHFDYLGGPRGYRWINTVPIAKIWEQMNMAHAYGADRLWITNVGDLKPMEYPTEFFLRMAWDPDEWPKERLEAFGRLWAAREFGPEHAAAIENLITGYTRHNGRRKPEHQNADTYSLLHYREAERISDEMEDMVGRAESIYEQLPKAKRDAYYQLVLYPVKASANITQMYIAQARNQLYAEQGRAYANDFGKRARERFREDARLEKYFHTELSDGRWNHMMSQPRIGYLYWSEPPANTAPLVYDYQPHGKPDMGIAVDGIDKPWPEQSSFQLTPFTPYGDPTRRLEIYNRGTRAFEFRARTDADWIRLNRSEGEVGKVVPVSVGVDWDKLPAGVSRGRIHVTGTGRGEAVINVTADKPAPKLLNAAKGFVEGDGYVSIEAAHYSRKRDAGGVAWEAIPLRGRTLSSMSTFPVNDKRFEDTDKAPYLEYDVYFFSTGEFDVTGIFSFAFATQPGRGLRYGIAFDGEKPQVVDTLADLGIADWSKSVLTGVNNRTTRHRIDEPGLHTLRIYRVDPAATLQKLIIDTGGLKPSYLAPPESARE